MLVAVQRRWASSFVEAWAGAESVRSKHPLPRSRPCSLACRSYSQVPGSLLFRPHRRCKNGGMGAAQSSTPAKKRPKEARTPGSRVCDASLSAAR